MNVTGRQKNKDGEVVSHDVSLKVDFTVATFRFLEIVQASTQNQSRRSGGAGEGGAAPAPAPAPAGGGGGH